MISIIFQPGFHEAARCLREIKQSLYYHIVSVKPSGKVDGKIGSHFPTKNSYDHNMRHTFIIGFGLSKSTNHMSLQQRAAALAAKREVLV